MLPPSATAGLPLGSPLPVASPNATTTAVAPKASQTQASSQPQAVTEKPRKSGIFSRNRSQASKSGSSSASGALSRDSIASANKTQPIPSTAIPPMAPSLQLSLPKSGFEIVPQDGETLLQSESQSWLPPRVTQGTAPDTKSPAPSDDPELEMVGTTLEESRGLNQYVDLESLSAVE
ncbi:uncharacterized protein BJ171DRAFT_506246 [Polychytrium aggregatum]|uniref:uncharacterized protein n=1 Tax=Polychytrium aggregatum TaxID=110093 RepID=UPI0022FF3C33|nr:uncharacterized protein BJ171DRAFT_506246 [Polychytrium aggregatum]KAI9204143.1 hypothetical protein BJ171DRAFT_506246 [Polychytrium aggregatum]